MGEFYKKTLQTVFVHRQFIIYEIMAEATIMHHSKGMPYLRTPASNSRYLCI